MANDSSTYRVSYIFSTGLLPHSVPKNICIFDQVQHKRGGGGVDQYSHDSDVEILQQQIPLASTFY
jgi:hypothetical protein